MSFPVFFPLDPIVLYSKTSYDISENEAFLVDNGFQGHSVAKSTGKKDDEAMHRKCLGVMDQIEKEFKTALGKTEEERAQDSQLLQSLRAEKVQETAELQQAIAAREEAVVENQRLETEIRKLQQQQESTNANMQDQVSWNDIQPVLHQTHGELVSATTRFWNTIEAFQDRMTSYLPGSGMIHQDWPGNGDPLETLGHNALPGFSSSSDHPIVTQQTAALTNHYGSLA
jgi:small-conductance mechanosensitive channel